MFRLVLMFKLICLDLLDIFGRLDPILIRAAATEPGAGELIRTVPYGWQRVESGNPGEHPLNRFEKWLLKEQIEAAQITRLARWKEGVLPPPENPYL